MMKDIVELKKKIAKHCDNNFRDSAAIGMAQYIFAQYSGKRVIANLESLDKWPSTDGYIEVQNENGIVGRIDVQVKSLPKNHDFKFDCPVPFLAYVDIISVAPCFLLLVEAESQKIYWMHISKEFIENSIPNYYKNNEKYRIKFSKENIISEQHKTYFEEWESIISEYQTKIREYDSQRALVQHLTKHQNSAIGHTANYFIPVHIALDYMDYYFSTLFEPIKRVSYPNAWKIGIVLTTFESNQLGYLLYPIFYDTNDVQIKFIDEATYKSLYVYNQYPIIKHLSDNPLITNPLMFALQACMQLFKESISKYLLNLPTSEILTQDIFSSLIKNYRHPLGLENKLEYTYSELQFAFDYYMPLWLDVAVEHLISNNINEIKTEDDCKYKSGLNKSNYFDPQFLAMQIIDKATVKHKVDELIERKVIPKHRQIGSKKHPIHLAYSFLRTEKITNIKFLYPEFDHKRCAKNGNYVFNLLSSKQLENKIKTIYSCLPKVYDEFVRINFGDTRPELLYYSWFDLVVIEYDLLDVYTDNDSPTQHIFYLTALEPVEKQTVIGEKIIDYIEYTRKAASCIGVEQEVVYRGVRYKIVGISSGTNDTLFRDYPLLKILYSTLESQLQHFINIINE